MNRTLKRLNAELIKGNSNLLSENPRWNKKGNIYNLSITEVTKSKSTCDIEVKMNYHSKNGYIYNCFFYNFKNNYPFKSPEVIINSKEYDGNICLPNEIVYLYLNKTNKKCLCCSSILCSNNWSPYLGLMDIVEEYIEKIDNIYDCYNYHLIVNNDTIISRLPENLSFIIFDFLIETDNNTN